jgi:hypothetical protein
MSLFILSGCGNKMRSKEKVQDAILQRVQTRSGLDLNALEVTTTSVSFDKNMAYATVSFHPKGDPSVNSGMVMKYTLEDRDGKWNIIKVGDSQGNGIQGHASPGATGLPPGHPSVDQAGGGSAGQLPPGHPQVDDNGRSPGPHSQPGADQPSGGRAQ